MAPEDVKSKKRKGAADAVPKPKKQRKADDSPRKASTKNPKAPAGLDGSAPIPATATRKRAECLPDEDTAANTEIVKEEKPRKKGKVIGEANGEAKSPLAEKRPRRAKKAKAAEGGAAPTAEAAVESPKKKGKKSKKAKQPEAPEGAPVKKAKEEKAVTEDDAPVVVEDNKPKTGKASKKQLAAKEASPQTVEVGVDENGEDEDDQTDALLVGFESDLDESDPEKEDEDFDAKQLKVPTGLLGRLGKVKEKEGGEPGVIFVGRIPHGFYESQMKAYFSQFGTVTRLRVSRNKKTGASKHYAFVEFACTEVAEIVAKTMDKYLMFGRILQCKVIPPEQVHPNLFIGANQRFKRHPRNKIAGVEMARGADRAVWEKRVANEMKRRASKNKKLKEALGYEFTAPALKSVEDVPKKAPALPKNPTLSRYKSSV